ncbi:hypothetical protein [Staphylococcus aureus]|uniref:hypothetical protein n=1 Tax=Staphylococcus aureus TaxID=1280 RepID=UPI0028FC4D32|nr:hypothetical protein [Staphylococcus aureus]MDU0235300.1 hypothetical protein [Staphylococcus aureus]
MLGTDELYKLLYRHMGPQNWWPADNDIEMMLGAILVQNTRWRNAEIALNQIKEHTHFNPNHFTNQDANEFHALLDVFGKHYFRDKDIKNYDFLEPYFKK